MTQSYIIAEAGVNHNGSIENALALVDAAVEAGVDAVKFQTFKAGKLVTQHASQADYQRHNTGKEESQLVMLSRLELSYDNHHLLLNYCHQRGIDFLSTAFDFDSLMFLVNELKLKRLKIGSGDITNAPLVLAHAQTGCDLIVSTGMATLSEIEQCLGVIAFGLIGDKEVLPSEEAFGVAYVSEQGKQQLKDKVTILHCTTEYPAPLDEINLKAMDTLAASFHLSVGYSDHSKGISIPIAAVAKGAGVIEKHFTLDCTMPGPDHKASLEPDELKAMVCAIREVEQAMGDGLKGPTFSEIKNKAVARKSLVAAVDIAQGEVLTNENLSCKRPGTGIVPSLYWHYLGKPARQAYLAGDLIRD